MMMLGERNHPLPAIHVPPWPTMRCSRAAMDALRCFVPGNDDAIDEEMEADAETTDLFSSDRFRIYEFKVRRCPRGRPHDWTECPYAHPGEKARRRDPRRFRYSSAACPDFRKGGCRRGDACELAHGVFECWLHPERYRTQPCKDGIACRRRVCFFAHTTDQLRVLSPRTLKGMMLNSPTSTLASPPLSPTYGGGSPPVSPGGLVVRRGMLAVGSPVDEVMVKMAKMQIGVPWGVGMRRGFGEHGGEDAGWPEEEQPLPDVDWVKELVK